MTTKEFVRLEKGLLPAFPRFALKGPLMISIPMGSTLRGFHFEPSSFNKNTFYVDMFFMPLYVPAKHVHFTFGHRVRRPNSDWNSEQNDLEEVLKSEMKKEMPFLLQLEDRKELVRALRGKVTPDKKGYVNPHCYEALSYTLILLSELHEAAHLLDTLLEDVNAKVLWEEEIAVRARLIRAKLLDPDAAKKQLFKWEAETVKSLGLEKFQQE